MTDRSPLWTFLIPGALLVSSLSLLPALATANCPDFELNGELHTLNADMLYAGQTFSVVAGGPLDLAKCSSVPGTGNITQGPDFTLRISKNEHTGRMLEFKVTSDCDSVMLVNTPGAEWLFDDDNAGNLDARIAIGRARDGIYDVWVGTYGNELCNATLNVETF